MPNINFNIEHNEEVQSAKEKIDELISEKLSEHSDKIEYINKEWKDNQLDFNGKTKGINIKGSLKIEKNEIQINASIPFIAVPFKSNIQKLVTDEIKKKLK
jgi:hypothetical protein